MERCSWVPEGDELCAAYHDEEWGVPERDDRALYELTLEGASRPGSPGRRSTEA